MAARPQGAKRRPVKRGLAKRGLAKRGLAKRGLAKRKSAATPRKRAKPAAGAQWSSQVTRGSDALDLEPSVFRSRSSTAIARSLKRSAEASRRRKGTAFQSAMSMLNFYINRGGTNLSAARKQVLQRAKEELRKAFHRGD